MRDRCHMIVLPTCTATPTAASFPCSYTPECQAAEDDRIIGTPCGSAVAVPRFGRGLGEAVLTVAAPALQFGRGFPLGVESGAIPDGQLSASSSFVPPVSIREDAVCQRWSIEVRRRLMG